MSTTNNYAGIPDEFAQLEKAKVVLIPVPYESASTWGKGSDKGPCAFLEASEQLEWYDIETDTEVYQQGIYLAPEVNEKSSSEALVEAVHKTAKEYIKRNKFVTLIGGEHAISIGSVRAFNECFDNLTVLHLDAHADVRKTFNGSKYNHACALHEASQNTNLVQVGIRSMDSMEKSFMDQERTFYAYDMVSDEYWIDKAIEAMTENVFITFDLDALDPSIMPATGTPEPGGLLWYETLDFLKQVFAERNVVGFDLMELCPDPAHKSADFLAAKLYYKMLSYKFMKEGIGDDYDNTYNVNSKANTNNQSRFEEDEE